VEEDATRMLAYALLEWILILLLLANGYCSAHHGTRGRKEREKLDWEQTLATNICARG
jgi:hypothetical protein